MAFQSHIRRTMGFYMAMSGLSDRLIGGALGQTTAQATNVYARLRTEPVRAAMLTGMNALTMAKDAAVADAKKAARAAKRKGKAAAMQAPVTPPPPTQRPPAAGGYDVWGPSHTTRIR